MLLIHNEVLAILVQYIYPGIWIGHRTNYSLLNELHLPMNRLHHFGRRQKLKYFGQVNRRNGLSKTIMQGMVAGKEAEESQDKDGRKTSHICLVQLQQHAEWQSKTNLGSDILKRTCSQKKKCIILISYGGIL